MSPKRPATNVAASVRARLRALARERGVEFQLILSDFAIERLLYRLGVSPHADRFVLKGATLFKLWSDARGRTTWGLDLLGRGASTVADVETVLKSLCDVRVDDGIEFDSHSVRGEETRIPDEYSGVRVRLEARLAEARIPVQADIGFGDKGSSRRRISMGRFRAPGEVGAVLFGAGRPRGLIARYQTPPGQTLARTQREGFHPVIIGRRDHVEVRGITEDLDDCDVVLCDEDVWRLGERERFGVVAQTTQPIERVRRLVQSIRRRFPQAEVRVIDTVCRPTKLRQNAAIELAHTCDAVVVIGGAHSSNTHELVKTCRCVSARVYHVQAGSDLRIEWCDGARTIGMTAGTSTPEDAITEVEQRLESLFGCKESREHTCVQSCSPVDHSGLRHCDGLGRGGGRVLPAHAGGPH